MILADHNPCSAADALPHIRQVKIHGVMTGIAMLDASIEKAQTLTGKTEICAALLKQIKDLQLHSHSHGGRIHQDVDRRIYYPIPGSHYNNFE